MGRLKQLFSKSFRHRSFGSGSSKTEKLFTTGETSPTNISFIPPKASEAGEFVSRGTQVVLLENSWNPNPTSSQKSSTFGNFDAITAPVEGETSPPPPASSFPSPEAPNEDTQTQLITQGASVPPDAFSRASPEKLIKILGAGFFPLKQPTAGEKVQTSDIHRNTKSLQQILHYVIPGAQYDSASRDTPPRCHPGTRTQILENVQTRIHDPNGVTRMVWIHGPAGVGKSAIMQTLAEAESSRGTTFASLFFSRPNERDDPKKAFPTIAYGLAALNLEYQVYIGERLHRDPMFLAKSMDEQFQRLFIVPFLEDHISFDSQRWIIFLDGLDECRGGREQCRIVDLIHSSLAHNATLTPFIWIIASRPEAHLRSSFMEVRIDLGSFWELEVPIDSDRSSRDVEHYLHAQFLTIREKYSGRVPSLWPSERDFLTLARASSGLFVFASTLMGYLSSGNPIYRLERILAMIEESRNQTINPLCTLDLLFTRIMSELSSLPICRHLLGFYLLEAALAFDRKPVPLLVASNILELDQHTTYAALRKLHSVLECPPPDEAEYQPIRFLHASFSDFLSDASRSQAYHIDLSQEITHLWQCHTRILRQHGVNRAYRDIKLSWIPTDHLQSIRSRLLGSAQRRWAKTLVEFWAAPPSNAHDIRLLIDPPSLIDVFHKLGPAVFTGIEDFTYPTDIFTWLDFKAPIELRQRLVVETFPLQELDIDRLFKSLCAQHWCWAWRRTSSGFYFNAVDLAVIGDLTVAQWAQAKEALWAPSSKLGELAQAQNGIVRVIGFELAGYYIIIGPISGISGAVYYILPYAHVEDW